MALPKTLRKSIFLISTKLPTTFADIAITFSGKNLNNQIQKLMGLSIYDRRYVLSLDLAIR